MRIKNKNRHDERIILIGMITDRTVLGRINLKWNNKLFKNKWSNIIGGWCIDYFKKYDKAPGKKIESIYQSKCEDIQSKDTIKIIEKFLDGLSDEYLLKGEDSNSDYILDVAGRYFNQVQLEILKEEIEGDIDTNKIEKANDRIHSFNKVELGEGEGIDIFKDKEAIKEAFKEKRKPLIKYKSGLGKFFGSAFARDNFIAFMGPDKRGKSFWLQDIAYKAAMQRRYVAYFEAGDNSRNQIMRRLMIKASRHPIKKQTITIPTKIKFKKEKKKVILKTKEKEFKKNLSWQTAWKSCQTVLKRKIKSNKTYFKLSVHPNSSLSVNKIKSILETWEMDGWVPDVIVIDYADIMDMNHAGYEGRDRINQTWKQLRALSQEKHCLVVTATQSDAAAYSADVIKPDNFSDDKRKAAHVTGMIGLNANEREIKKGMIRLNWVVLREDEFAVSRCCHVAGCKAIGDISMKSVY